MISAILLAAGESKRMGQPKMLLPWGNSTVIAHVISVFSNAGIKDILVVTGGAQESVETVVKQSAVRSIHNDNYATGEMLSSLQCGLHAMSSEVQAVLIGLGDQPQVEEGSVRLICHAFQKSKAKLVVPSFQMRRGHPWLVARPLWDELLEMKSPESPREFLNKFAREIHYVEAGTSSILTDMDTPEDYQKSLP